MSELVKRRVLFECGHRALWPDDWTSRIAAAAYRKQPQIEEHWRGQTPARGLGDSRMCPHCPGSRGLPQTVVGVVSLPVRVTRQRGR